MCTVCTILASNTQYAPSSIYRVYSVYENVCIYAAQPMGAVHVHRDLHEYIKFSHQYIQCTCSTCTQAGTDKEKGEMATSMHVYECMNMDAAVLHLCTLYVYMYSISVLLLT